MCETWTNERSDITLEGYEHYAFHRKRKPRAKRDSGGLILYYRTNIAKGIKFLKKFGESVIWIELDKEFFKLEQTIIIACCYVVPQGSSRNDILDINVFDELVMSIAQYASLYEHVGFIIMGDFNARTATDADLVVNDNNEYLPLPDDYINDVTMNDRISKDIRAPTANGRQLLDTCKSCSVRLLNGRYGHDRGVGEFTFHSTQGSSVVDYIAMSTIILHCICDFNVLDVAQAISDHNMLSCQIIVGQLPQIYEYKAKTTICKWNPCLSEQFVSALEGMAVNINNVINETVLTNDHDTIDIGVERLTSLINEASAPFFHKTHIACNDVKGITKSVKPPYYTVECEQKRKLFFERLNIYRDSGHGDDRIQMLCAKPVRLLNIHYGSVEWTMIKFKQMN